MTDLEHILADHLGCWQTEHDRCGEHSTRDHRMPWPCERLTRAVGDVQEWHDREVNREVGAALTALMCRMQPPAAPVVVECCASGRCEVCAPSAEGGVMSALWIGFVVLAVAVLALWFDHILRTATLAEQIEQLRDELDDERRHP